MPAGWIICSLFEPPTLRTLTAASHHPRLFVSYKVVIILIVVVLKRPRPRRWVAKTIPDIQALLGPPNGDIGDLLHARAVANTRIAQVFALNNPFVSADRDVRKTFVGKAGVLLHRWRLSPFSATARALITDLLSHMHADSPSVDFAAFIQAATFIVIVDGFLEGEVAVEDWEDVVFVTRGINELWATAKKGEDGSPGLLQAMNTRLARWLPQHERPLEFVIPAYETMWRVVAVTVARADQDTLARRAFREFLEVPTIDQFRQLGGGDTRPSVEAYLSEVLRLHPPVKRIGRAFPTPFYASLFHRIFGAGATGIQAPRSLCVADIEAVHLDPDVWGSAAADFDPMRFRDAAQKGAWMPFGFGPLKCAASREAPQIAAIIAAAVLESTSPGALASILRGDRIGGRDSWEEWRVMRAR